MAIEDSSGEFIPAESECYYEERASEEEVYLEVTEEELRAKLILDTRQDVQPTPSADTALAIVSRGAGKSISE